MEKDLMTPRVKCIERFLGMKREGWDINTIVEVNNYTEDALFILSLPKQFPKNFELLNWWEERDIEDMPKYVKIIDENVIAKVEEHNMNLGFTYKETSYFKTEHSRRKVYSTNVIPSTEQEYNDYINSKS